MRISLTTFAGFSICRPVHTELFLFVCVLLTALGAVVPVGAFYTGKEETAKTLYTFLRLPHNTFTSFYVTVTVHRNKFLYNKTN